MLGLAELRAALRQLPAELTADADAIVLAHAEDAHRVIEDAYPVGKTGNLKAGVTTERNRSRFATSAIVRSRARHANLFERGTKARFTKRGWARGTMPEADVAKRMIPKVIRARQRMVNALVGLVKRAGFEVDA